MSTYRMYAACLASYNNGTLHGAWIDLDGKDADEIKAEVAAMLRTSPHPNVRREDFECRECDHRWTVDAVPSGQHAPMICPACLDAAAIIERGGEYASAEEWAAHDWEGADLADFGEFPDLEKVVEHVELVEEHGEAWLAYVEHVGTHYATADDFADTYQGTFDTEISWAEDFIESSGMLAEIPPVIAQYFDYEAYARDARLSGDVAFVRYNGELYAFSG